ncbi:MAG: HrpJ domain-containing protein [Limnohabitans sp.]|jgi:type III secretion system YopN/LcrE/InvE/MxiC family regulator
MATLGNTFAPRVDPQRIDLQSAARTDGREDEARAARQGVAIRNDPTLMMAEMAEELGFLRAEAQAGSDEIEGDAEDAFEDLISELIRQSLKAQSGQPGQAKQDADTARERLIRMQLAGTPSPQLDEVLRQFSGGSSQQGLAIMAELVRMAQTDPELRRLGYTPQALEDYAAAHEAGLVAALNIADALDLAPDGAQDAASRLLGLYESAIASSQSVLQTFQTLGQSEGIATIAQWRGFLTEAVAADLSQQTSGGEKVQLQLILQELKGFRTFNTLSQGLERLGKYLPRQGGPDAATLMQTTLDYVAQPVREFPKVEAWVAASPTAQQILFFQSFRNLLKAVPDDAYASPEQKAGLLVSPQKRIDDLTFTEDV